MSRDSPAAGRLVPSSGWSLLFDGGELIDVSPDACRELDRGRDELLGTGFSTSLVHADEKALTATLAVLAASDGGDGTPTRLSVRRRNGDVAVDALQLRLLGCGEGLVHADVRDGTEQVRLEEVLGSLANATFVADAAAKVTWWLQVDEWTRALAGADEDDGTGLNWLHPDDLPIVLEAYARLLDEPGRTEVLDVRTRVPHLENTWTRVRLTAVNKLGDPRIAGLVLRVEHQSTIDTVGSIGETSGVFRSLAETAPMGIVVTDRDGRAVYFNSLARELFGLGEDPSGDVAWTTGVRAEHQEAFAAVVTGALERQEVGSLAVAIDRPGRPTVWCRLDVHPEIDENGHPFGMIATLQDVTAETQARQALVDAKDELWKLANHDALTGLPNRAFLMDRLERATARRKRAGTSVAVLYCDLDGFKAVNDCLGHLAGDAVLVEASRRLLTVIRETDTIGRLGGDEFLVICEGFTGIEQIEMVAARIVDAISAPITIAGAPVRVGVSVGIAIDAGPTLEEPTIDDSAIDDLVRRADQAMYKAKTAGKGSYQLAG